MEFSATTLNLASMVSHHARLTPDKEAIVWNDVRMTYGQLDAMSNRVAHALVEMGIGHGDKVAAELSEFAVISRGLLRHNEGRCGGRSAQCSFQTA
jgi:acyl-coenzyme A synthetase/AMP-(fatty) acid ligase